MEFRNNAVKNKKEKYGEELKFRANNTKQKRKCPNVTDNIKVSPKI
jgi:hypothetical protein